MEPISEPFRSALRDGRPGTVADAEASTAEARFGRALARARVGRLAEAREDFAAAVSLGPVATIELAFLDVVEGRGLRRVIEQIDGVLRELSASDSLRARALHVQGLALGKLRRAGPATESLLEAVVAYGRQDDRAGQAAAHDSLGNLYASRGQLESAVGYYSLSLAEKSLCGDRQGIAITLGNLGRVHLRAGRFTDAVQCFEADLRIADELGDQRGRARMLEDMGRARIGLEEPREAMRDLEDCLELASGRDFRDIGFFAHKDLALALLEVGRLEGLSQEILDRAGRELDAAEKLLGVEEDPARECSLLAARGELFLAQGDPRSADVLEEAVRMCAECDLPDLEIPTLITLARALAARGSPGRAQECLVRALSSARRDGYARYLPAVREAMKRLDLPPGPVEEAGRLDVVGAGEEIADGYTGIRLVGRGGFGEVYRALDPRANRVVAIKRLRLEELYDSATRKRLLASLRVEMEAAASIRHPGVARVFAIGTDSEERPYLVQEFIEGRSLREVMRAGVGTALREIVPPVQDMASALEELHAHGIVHRDLKPENVLLRSSTGRPVLIDFGIACVPTCPETRELDSITGTLAYMAPEQALGGAIEERSDIYALGVVLWEWLTGKRPYTIDTSSSSSLLDSFRRRTVPRLENVSPGIDRDVAELTESLLEPRVQYRPYASEVARFCHRLASRLEGERPVSPVATATDVASPDTMVVRAPGREDAGESCDR